MGLQDIVQPLAGWLNRDYSPPSVLTKHPITSATVFMPDGNPEDYGWNNGKWPFIVHHSLSGYLESVQYHQIDKNFDGPYVEMFHKWLENGYVLITASLPVAKSDLTSTNPSNDPIPFNIDYDNPSPSYGVFYKGGGAFTPPSESATGYVYSGPYSGVTHPYMDPEHLDPMRCSVMLAQWVIFNAAELNLDLDRSVCHGNSAGSSAANWVYWGPNRAPQTWPQEVLDLGGQESLDTRNLYKTQIISQAPTWWQIYNELGSLVPPVPSPNNFRYQLNVALDSDEGNPLAPDFNTPSLFLGDQLAGVLKTTKDASSPIIWMKDVAVAAENATKTGLWMYFQDPDWEGAPYDETNLGFPTLGPDPSPGNPDPPTWERGKRGHTLWSGMTAKTAMPNLTLAHTVLDQTGAFLMDHFSTGLADIQRNTLAELEEYTLTFLSLTIPPQFTFLPAEDPLPAASKSKYFRISIFNSEVDSQGNQKVYRAINTASPNTVNNNVFESQTEMVITPGTYTIGLEDTSWKLKLQIDPNNELMDQISKGEPIPPTFMTIRQVNNLEVGGTSDLLYLGPIAKIVVNPRGEVGFIELEGLTAKQLLDIPTQLPLEEECTNIFGDDLCGYDIDSDTVTATVTSIDNTVVQISGLPAVDPGLDKWYHRGRMVLQETKIHIKDWDPVDPSTFYLLNPPPAAWLGETVSIVPGCNRTELACTIRNRISQFNGAGIKMPLYNPEYEDQSPTQ